MMEKYTELLAPAGNYPALVGAVNAGADAVYLGGDRFSARAYADNFTKEEILKALRYTHINGKKVYLTLNTLVKEKEFALIYDYVRPFYEAGLDGIIIQDLGVWAYIREVFPDLPLHASTQMTITGAMGAALLKDAGAARIVPARELSLAEIKDIKEKTGLEIECFIHGAMCYCYSGQCLFSSILGGRSGNRGRCAQPCRLPYKVSVPDKAGLSENSGVSGDASGKGASEELYPLSLKDMCTIEYIPQLIGAGIDSFKIEGRMKKPEYAAGVTAIYRKYIDSYYEKGAGAYYVEQTDMDRLRKLYIRSEVQTGYYERYNGREMVTLGKGNYLGRDDALLKDISEKYLKEEKKLPVNISAAFKAGEPAVLNIEGGGIKHTCYGDTVQEALKRPMGKEDILKQLSKTGNSHIDIAEYDIEVCQNVFVPIVSLNELRRTAITEFEDKIIAGNGLVSRRIMQHNLQKHLQNDEPWRVSAKADAEKIYEKPLKYGSSEASFTRFSQSGGIPPKLHVNVRNMEQFRMALKYPCDRIYVDGDLYIKNFDQISQCLKKHTDFAIFLSLPFVIRAKDIAYLDKIKKLSGEKVKGFLVKNLESLYWISTLGAEYDVVIDSGIYCFNHKAAQFLQMYADEICLPWELNAKEALRLTGSLSSRKDIKVSMPVYGTIPMMVSANCVKKTVNSCNKSDCTKCDYDKSCNKSDFCGIAYLTDRYNAKFPVLCNCVHCYNTIYNSLPYSLHKERKNLEKLPLSAIRLDFVFENGEQTGRILDYYTGKTDVFPVSEYTAGHYKRGVE